ncbi:MAG: alkaline phosphatase family protein, partial [Planctomycetales bacterium]|nr:alkaline phosphatase family protein [Planctomycetales bacterium]
PHRLFVPAHETWIDTGIDVPHGAVIDVQATGAATIRQPLEGRRFVQATVGPEGTFHYADDDFDQPFPMAAAGRGPAPCFSLIGRIGIDGEPFFVGQRMSRASPGAGRLFLGLNDFDHSDNHGGFDVAVRLLVQPQPLRIRQRVPANGPPGRPAEDAAVIIFYVDGLRPDVVEQMSAMGHLPNISELFIQGGTQVEHSFTVFPSDTITSNGSMWTGCFSDRHGIKAQIGFNRSTRESENYLGTMGPVQTGMLLEREGLDRLILRARERSISMLRGPQAAEDFHASKTSDVPAMYHYVKRSGGSYNSGVLPIMNEMSPTLWTRYIADEAPLFGTPEADRFVDEANTGYAVEHMLRGQDKVTIVWLPETDTVSHHEFRGQFGQARRTIAEADRLIGEVVTHVRRQGRFDKTYFVMVSDHGHIGGQHRHLERFDLANEFFHRPRLIGEDGRWIGGGLGLSVRQHRYWNRTDGDGQEQFVFVEAVGDGVARVFLPRGSYHSADWSGPNSVGQLMQYKVADHLPPVDLIRALTTIEAHDVPPELRRPIDLVLAKVDDNAILITSGRRGQAIIDRRRNAAGEYVYRYQVVGDVRPTASGGITYQPVTFPVADPLGLLEVIPADAYGQYHNERRWLYLTLGSAYPDSVVAMTRHLLWDERLKPREMQYAPDLVVCSGPDWQFNTFNEPGTAHGHPVHETMRNSLFVSGPGVRRGALLTDPARNVDLMPTVLEMAGVEYDGSAIDGRPLRTLFVSERVQPPTVTTAEYWQEIDLGGWQRLDYEPRPIYPIQPESINRPKSQLDLNNVVYNTLSLQEVSVNRLLDDSFSLLGNRRRPIRTLFRRTMNWSESRAAARRGQTVDSEWLADGLHATHWNKIGLGDYSVYSTGNLARIDSSVDWVQQRATNLDNALARPLRANTVLATPFTNRVIDATQTGAREVRRVGTRAVFRVVDDWLLNGTEDRIDALWNQGRRQPAELRLSRPSQREATR